VSIRVGGERGCASMVYYHEKLMKKRGKILEGKWCFESRSGSRVHLLRQGKDRHCSVGASGKKVSDLDSWESNEQD